MNAPAYREFLEGKRQVEGDDGFEPIWMPDYLFDFQYALTDWAIRKGRAALMAMPGLGKSPMEFVWAENVARHTGGNVLILAPLAVTHSLLRESEKFGVEAKRSQDGTAHRITITNYERLHLFNPSDFVGVACDEASILKNFDGVTRTVVTEFLRTLRYRLLASGLLSPNDYFELGTSSEALGYLGYTDMLNRFFRNDQGSSSTTRGFQGSANKWRLKGHAKESFYRWVCSWGRVARTPSDLGDYDDSRFQLPPLKECDMVVSPRIIAEGRLFDTEALTLEEQREENRRTIPERCEAAAQLLTGASCAVGWVNLNAEGDLLTKLVPGAVQVSGGDSDERKEEVFLAFERGEIKKVITKASIAAWGLNWQHCQNSTVFPTHSYEQYFQLIRRFWRFGQTQPVTIHRVLSEGGRRTLDNLERKARQTDLLFAELVRLMGDAQHIQRGVSFPLPVEVPAWLC